MCLLTANVRPQQWQHPADRHGRVQVLDFRPASFRAHRVAKCESCKTCLLTTACGRAHQHSTVPPLMNVVYIVALYVLCDMRI